MNKLIIPFLLILVLLNSCQNDQKKKLLENQSKLFLSTTDCGRDTVFEVDTSKLVAGTVENLKVFNGIKFFKFGSSVETFSPCLECVSIQGFDSCRFLQGLPFLGHEWEFIVYFFEKSLVGVKMKLKSQSDLEINDVRLIYSKLSKVYGEPNVEKLHIIGSKFISKDFFVYSKSLETLKPFSESADEIIGSVEIADEEIENKLNSLIKDGSKIDINAPKTYLKTPISLKKYFEYFPEVIISAKWGATKTLDLKMIRENDLLIWNPSYDYNIYLPKTNNHYNESHQRSKYDFIQNLNSSNGYLFYESWGVELFFLKNSLSEKLLDKFRINRRIAETERRKIEESKKVKEIMKDF